MNIFSEDSSQSSNDPQVSSKPSMKTGGRNIISSVDGDSSMLSELRRANLPSKKETNLSNAKLHIGNLSDPKDYYAVLGVTKDATQEQIATAYKKTLPYLTPIMGLNSHLACVSAGFDFG